jgi:DNA-binding XRE family transcriptional regulator
MSDDQSTTPVEYREIPRFVGYRFGDDGSFWSRWDSCSRLTDRWTQLWGQLDGAGYVRVTPKDADLGRFRRVLLHQLILEAFRGPCPPGMEARHFPDRDPANNRIENLNWGTPAQNSADKKVHGTHQAGTKNGNHKLNEEQVAEIRERIAAGATGPELAPIYGVSKGTIINAAYGDKWKGMSGPPPVERPKIRRPHAKLSRPQVDEIRRLRAAGMTQVEIASRFGVSRRNIGAICQGRSWTDVLPELTGDGRVAASSIVVAAD